ncbi:hypothetical protein Rsub_03760 [Raphidocelis subcapitata]|uniref:ShKT domain-containing protein n=1 Tax=Raphidocelis subcapitata TaxID=307507 RepID=A0A2V0P1D7_9CHLO|nr:hypothetical protein Rsub_03760 [Raphidocelis subcapitata]|eukprot:GBF90905.1 hypothetical protein Rsub_03760 [Raphidocelis subcapitata]
MARGARPAPRRAAGRAARVLLAALPLLVLAAAAAAAAPLPPAAPAAPPAGGAPLGPPASPQAPAPPPPPAAARAASVHTIFLSDCGAAADWQAFALAYSWRESGQPGALTRIMSCSAEEARARAGRDAAPPGVSVHVAPSLALHPRTGDHYSAYNKPGAVADWLKHAAPEEEWVLILDSDMILRRPFDPEALGLKAPGTALAARQEHLAGVKSGLADRHIPEVAPRRDAAAGPEGRRADQVGGFVLLHRDDLRRVAPFWLKYTEDVRADPNAWRDAGDAAARREGAKPWLAEVYGYAFAAARADVWHKWDNDSMVHPGNTPLGVPRLLHYNAPFGIVPARGKRWSFFKRDYADFDFSKCPPWEGAGEERPKEGLMPLPPLPSQLRKQRYRELLTLQPVVTVNAALCAHYAEACPASDDLAAACEPVEDARRELQAELKQAERQMACGDYFVTKCRDWASRGQCETNKAYMEINCRVSCNLCTPAPADGADGANATAPAVPAHSPRPRPPPPPPHSPPPPRPPSPPPPPAPPPPPPSEAALLHLKYQPAGGVDYKSLLRRCYEAEGLSAEAARECVHASALGLRYTLPPPPPARPPAPPPPPPPPLADALAAVVLAAAAADLPDGDASGGGAAGAGLSGTAALLWGQGDGSGGGGGGSVNGAHLLGEALPSDARAAGLSRRGGAGDVRPPRARRPHNAILPRLTAAAARPSHGGAHGGGPAARALMLWLVVVGVVLVLLSYACRRRRARSGLRID